jgi:hypothetical protein
LKRNAAILALVFSVTILLAMLSVPASAFYEQSFDSGFIDLRGMVRGFGIAYENPEDNFFYENKSAIGVAAIARLLMQSQAGQHLGFEFNAYQTYIPSSLASHQGSMGTPLDVERSAALEWSFSDDEYIHLAIDRSIWQLRSILHPTTSSPHSRRRRFIVYINPGSTLSVPRYD